LRLSDFKGNHCQPLLADQAGPRGSSVALRLDLDSVTDPHYASNHDPSAQAGSSGEKGPELRPGQPLQVAAGLAQPDALQSHFADPEAAANQLVQPHSAGDKIAASVRGFQCHRRLPGKCLEAFQFDQGDFSIGFELPERALPGPVPVAFQASSRLGSDLWHGPQGRPRLGTYVYADQLCVGHLLNLHDLEGGHLAYPSGHSLLAGDDDTKGTLFAVEGVTVGLIRQEDDSVGEFGVQLG
jgi:hypothetical protein